MCIRDSHQGAPHPTAVHWSSGPAVADTGMFSYQWGGGQGMHGVGRENHQEVKRKHLVQNLALLILSANIQSLVDMKLKFWLNGIIDNKERTCLS